MDGPWGGAGGERLRYCKDDIEEPGVGVGSWLSGWMLGRE